MRTVSEAERLDALVRRAGCFALVDVSRRTLTIYGAGTRSYQKVVQYIDAVTERRGMLIDFLIAQARYGQGAL
jgi:hypothetical protein